MANIRNVTVSYGKRVSPAAYQHEELSIQVGVDYAEDEAGLDQLTPLMLKAAFAVQQVVHERLGVERQRPPADFVVDTTAQQLEAEASKKSGSKRRSTKKAEKDDAGLEALEGGKGQDLSGPEVTKEQIAAQAKADVRGDADPLAALDGSAKPAGDAGKQPADAGLGALNAAPAAAQKAAPATVDDDPIKALEAAAATKAPEPTMVIEDEDFTTMVAAAIKKHPDFGAKALAFMRECGHLSVAAMTQEQRQKVVGWIAAYDKAK